jgi:uncharacterized protein
MVRRDIMKIAIAGGTGFVGNALTKVLLNNNSNNQLYILTRNPGRQKPTSNIQYVEWMNAGSRPEWILDGIDVFINLAGESLNSGRWTTERKQRIVNSRIESANEMVRIISCLKKSPSTVLAASAIGFYGMSDEQTFIESSPSVGDDFLAVTVKQWEQETKKVEPLTSRLVLARFGVILGKDNGALPKMVLPYKLYSGGTIGNGCQWLSWIHIKDVANAIKFCIENNEIQGAVNFTAPAPERMKKFGKTIGSVLNRPHWLPVPSFVLRLLLAEMSVLVLEGQFVLPGKLSEFSFDFEFPELTAALRDLLT